MYNLEADQDIELLIDSSPVDAFEAAKRMIGYDFQYEDDTLDRLSDIAADPEMGAWNRMAAIYVLGFVDTDRRTEPMLTEILLSESDREIITFAKEALETMPVVL